MTRAKPTWLMKLRPILILLGGVLLMFLLIISRRKLPRDVVTFPGVLVEVMEVRPQDRQVTVRGHGTVSPSREITLAPQVSGRVEWLHPNFVTGGSFRSGQTMLKIESIDYRLAAENARAAVAQAEYGYQVAQANADIAGREWELMKQNGLPGSNGEDEKPQALVLHEPQLKQAEANLASARAQLELAELNLSRTEIVAPFACRVRSESVDPGQFVTAGTRVATLYGTEVVEIEVGLPISELSWIEIPGSKAIVRLDLGNGTRTSWEGRVDRTLGFVDEVGRLARVVVQVKSPYEKTGDHDPELAIGTFVEAEILGRTVSETVPLPRAAVHSGSTVWVANPDSTLDIRTVQVLRMTPQEVLVADGLKAGDWVVLTPLTGVAQGMKLRPVVREETP